VTSSRSILNPLRRIGREYKGRQLISKRSSKVWLCNLQVCWDGASRPTGLEAPRLVGLPTRAWVN